MKKTLRAGLTGLLLLFFAAALLLMPDVTTQAAREGLRLCAQVLVVDASKGEVTVEADCGVSGSGASLSGALEDMRAHAPGELFLDTAEHIVLRERAWYLLPQAASCRALRPAARLARAGGELPGIEELRAFLQAHPPALTLAHAYASLLRGKPVYAPQLTQTEGRLSLAG